MDEGVEIVFQATTFYLWYQRECRMNLQKAEGGFKSIHGDHSFLLHWRMYHRLPHHSSNTGGLSTSFHIRRYSTDGKLRDRSCFK